MKRRGSLQPLSREHHAALVQAKRLRDFSGGREKATELAGAFLAVWRSDIAPHFREEEEILLPLIARYCGSDNAEITETLHQHVRLRLSVLELTRMVEDEQVPDAQFLNGLGDDLRNHVRFEEGQLFPFAEQLLNDRDERYLLDKLGGT